MVFLTFGLVAVVLGLAAGGKLEALAELGVRALWMTYVAIALQLVAFPSGVFPWSMPSLVAKALWLLSYALLIAFLVANRHVRGVVLIGLGLACNLVAILANGGLMPVTRSALRAAGLSYHIQNNSISAVQPHLSVLVDRWAAPHWLPLANVYSIGDVLIGLGTLAVVMLGMEPEEPEVGWQPAPQAATAPTPALLAWSTSQAAIRAGRAV